MDRLDEAAENVRKVLPNTHIEWVRENVAEKLGVTQEEMARFLAEQEARAEEKARQWLVAKVELCRGNPWKGSLTATSAGGCKTLTVCSKRQRSRLL